MLFERMFCRMCGKQLDDDVKFCPECGADLSDAPAQVDAPAVDFTLNTENTQPVKKKSKKLWAILIPTIAVVVALAVAAAMLLPGMLAAKNDPQTMLDNAFSGFGSKLGAMISSELSAYEQLQTMQEGAVSGSVGIELSQTLLDLAGMGMSEDMDWLRQIRIEYLTAVDGAKMQLDAGLYLGETYITGVEFSYDMDSGKIWISLPDLHDLPLFEKIEPVDVQVAAPPYEQILAILIEEKETVSLIVEKFFAAYFDMIVAERAEEVALTIDEKDYTVTAIYSYSDSETVYRSGREFLTWLSEYDEFYTLLDRLETLLVGYMDEETIGLSDSARQALAEALEEMEPEAGSESRIDHCIYLDQQGSLIGYALMEDGVSTVDVIFITDGNKTVGRIGTASASVLFDITENNGAFSGQITGKTFDGQSSTWSFEDLRLDKDNYSGTICIDIPKAVIRQLTGELGFAPEAELRLTMDGNAKEADMKLELVLADMTMLTLFSSGKVTDSFTMSFPEDGVDSTDLEAVEQWLLELDYEQLVTNALEAGVPESVVMAMLYGVAGQ